ncbi:hypothetical protein NBZ79_02400 [Sneathiella marina]|uniref:Lipoprotein n=1 Tax=Sneathiella marina TaxID=2950108 RepID=A0ABY4W6R8_9PROT|nr:hypothetical protein [Sneathiella marina]USG61823.1 hypothetical protein NBZ79_02400 [Sneathiella marina]
MKDTQMTQNISKFLGFLVCIPFLSGCADSDYLPGGIAAYDAEDCAPVVEQEIDRLSIDRSNITKIEYIKSYISMGEIGELYDYEGWLSFKNCKGNYVVKMNRSCQIQAIYPRNECQLDKIVKNSSS